MARQRKQVDIVLLHIHRNLARSLYAVNVEKGSVCLGDLADLGDRIDYPDLVIGGHDRDQDGLRGDGAAHVVQVDAAVLLHRQIGDLEAVLLQALAGVQHRLMFDYLGDDVVALLAVHLRDAFDGQVIRFRGPTGEDDLLGIGVDQTRYLGAGVFPASSAPQPKGWVRLAAVPDLSPKKRRIRSRTR